MKKIILIVLGVVVLIVGYYGISPLFRNVEVDDALPVAPPSANVMETLVVESGFENLTPERQKEMTDLMEEVNVEVQPAQEEVMPEEAVVATTDPFLITGTLGHPAEGQVRVIDTGDERIIRFENFETINGPLLHVYLSKDLKGKDFIDLGPIRGTSGNINYTVPKDVDLSEYKYVLHWCVPFSVLFNYAPLQ